MRKTTTAALQRKYLQSVLTFRIRLVYRLILGRAIIIFTDTVVRNQKMFGDHCSEAVVLNLRYPLS
jgi:hypothetical protein